MSSISVKTPYYSPWFSARNENFDFAKKRMPTSRASKEEQNNTNFSSVAPFSMEL